MKFRIADYKDIHDIMRIISKAQEQFKKDNVDQWQNNYPNYDTIEDDIKNKKSYVLLKDGLIVGTVYVSFDGDETYKRIYEGEWLSHDEYAVIHRIAIDLEHRGLGLASIIMRNIEEIALSRQVYSIKVDTHRENLPMQRLLKNHGYQYCGVVYLKDKGERIAFEKLLDL